MHLDYDRFVVYFSGGKDSLACALHLLELGVPKSKIELWHHDVDGREHDGQRLRMDWPCTPDYCRAVADALGLPIYFSWKVGGFEREMLRENSKTAPTRFETPGGKVEQIGGTRGKESTRRRFPQVSANLSVRWCSAYLKIDPGAAAINNQERFRHSRTLTISGERAEESAARARYQVFEPDRTDNRNGRHGRHVDRWRPVHDWPERKVWEIIECHKINPHPAYHLGWGRVSCFSCIFGSDDQWASVAQLAPAQAETIADYEREFDCTIHRTLSVPERVERGTPYKMEKNAARLAMAREFSWPVILKDWVLPAGAFGDSCGPT